MDGFSLVPAVEMDGRWTVADSAVHAFWDRIVEDDLDHVFWGSEIASGDQLVAMLKSPIVVGIFVADDTGLIGLAWLNEIRRNYACAHFLTLKSTWGRITVEMGQRVLEYWWGFDRQDGTPLFDVLIGNIPANNQMALAYINTLGFERVGPIPKIALGEDMVINYLERPHGRQ